MILPETPSQPDFASENASGEMTMGDLIQNVIPEEGDSTTIRLSDGDIQITNYGTFLYGDED